MRGVGGSDMSGRRGQHLGCRQNRVFTGLALTPASRSDSWCSVRSPSLVHSCVHVVSLCHSRIGISEGFVACIDLLVVGALFALVYLLTSALQVRGVVNSSSKHGSTEAASAPFSGE